MEEVCDNPKFLAELMWTNFNATYVQIPAQTPTKIPGHDCLKMRNAIIEIPAQIFTKIPGWDYLVKCSATQNFWPKFITDCWPSGICNAIERTV